MRWFLLISTLLYLNAAWAELDPRADELHQIIDEIKKKNPKTISKLELTSGLYQISGNGIDATKINPSKILPYIGVKATIFLSKHIAFEGRYYHFRNMLASGDASAVNDNSVSQNIMDAGLRYQFYLDATNLEDTLGVRILYHRLSNNFNLVDDPTAIFVKEYSAFLIGAERSLPLTEKVSLTGSLDLILITDATSDSQQKFSKSGLGFQMRSSIEYRGNWFGSRNKLLFNYWQGGYVNRLSDDAQTDTNLTSHVQTFRALGLGYQQLF